MNYKRMQIVIAGILAIGSGAFAQNAAVSPGSIIREAVDPPNLENTTDPRVYILFKPGEKVTVASLVQRAGGQIHYEFDSLNAIASTVPATALEAIRRNPNVLLVENDPPRYLLGCEMTPEQVPYGVEMVQALDPNVSPQYTGSGVKIGVIDSGVFAGHPDFQGVTLTGEPADWNVDGLGHGTHVCGTIAAQAGNFLGVMGVSPGASIHMVKVFGADGSWIYSSTLLNAAQACQAAGCSIISMSLGGGYSAVEDVGFRQLYDAGILLVAAAGNGGNTSTIYPAGYGSVISVAAVDQEGAVASFSQRNPDVELAAPGVGVLSTVSYCEQNSVTVASAVYSANHLENSGRGVVTAPLVDGRLALTTNTKWRGKVVLVQRGVTNFITKVTNVQKSGGKACVIYNNAAGNFTGTLGSGNSSDIPAVSISQEDGNILLATALGQNTTVSSSRADSVESYAYYSGTSMSTPHASAVAALAWSSAPGQPNTIIRAALRNGALDLGDQGRDDLFGYGLVQAANTIALLSQPESLLPVSGDPLPLEISNVGSKVIDAKRGTFEITWTTSIPATSQVEFVGQSGAFTDTGYVINHSMSFRGPKGSTVQYYVSSTDAYGRTLPDGPYTHQN